VVAVENLKYSAVRDNLKTGDLVLMSGDSLVSRLIQLGTRSKWSHVGMVIKSEMGVLLWESTTLSTSDDLDSGRPVRGVQTCFLSDRIKNYGGDIGLRVAKNSMTPEALKLMSTFRDKVRGRPYEQNRLELVASALDFIDVHNHNDLTSLFCSELVAEALQHCQWLNNDIPSNEFTPADFARPVIPCNFRDMWESEIYEISA